MSVHRGTCHANERGNTRDRLARRTWLVEKWRANVDAVVFRNDKGDVLVIAAGPGTIGERVMACRCYRCGVLLTVETVTVDRIVPGCQGGRYVRNNIRPACAACNSETGATTRS